MDSVTTIVPQLQESGCRSAASADEDRVPPHPAIRAEEIAQMATFRVCQCVRQLAELVRVSESPTQRRELESLCVELARLERRLM
jgi:hypothetical protein